MVNQIYNRFRQSGYNPVEAARASRTLAQWEELERAGLVRLRAEPEEENYFDVFGEPEAYTDAHGRRVSAEQAHEKIIQQLDTYGCWYTVGEYCTESSDDCRACRNGDRCKRHWEPCDGVGMHTGYRDVLSPYENHYIIDIMAGTMAQRERDGADAPAILGNLALI